MASKTCHLSFTVDLDEVTSDGQSWYMLNRYCRKADKLVREWWAKEIDGERDE